MSRRTIQLGSRVIFVSPDDPIPPVRRLQAVVSIRVTDELTGGPPDSLLSLEVKERGFLPRVASGGLIGLVGVPQEVFPGLKTQDYFLHLTVRAGGYVSRDAEVQLTADPQFPTIFTPPPLINLALHRQPIIITGRTMRPDGDVTTPLAGATVSITGIWRTRPSAKMTVPPSDPPNLVSLRPPLHASRAAVSGLFQPHDLSPVVGNDKLLLEEVMAGANPIRLSNPQNLDPGDILLIDARQPDIAEFLVINAVSGVSTADQPAQITLDFPVVRAHRQNAVVQEVFPQPLGTMKQFTVEALAGDTCIFLTDIIGLAAVSEVQIAGGTSFDEYHHMRVFSVTSDADGYYRLPPLSRVAQLEIHAEKAVGVQTFTTSATFRPDYRQRENRLDLTLTV